jgi:hypothetical protein
MVCLNRNRRDDEFTRFRLFICAPACVCVSLSISSSHWLCMHACMRAVKDLQGGEEGRRGGQIKNREWIVESKEEVYSEKAK